MLPRIFPLIVFLLLFSCRSKDKRVVEVKPSITAGQSFQLLNEQASEEGILYAERPGDSLDGFLMFVPDTGFRKNKKFNISYQPILSHTLGPDFNPVSPLITISCGGGFSDSLVTMEIPVHLSEGQFAMGFLYDERTNELEGMPLLKVEKDRVVIVLRNFEYSKGKNENRGIAHSGTNPGQRMMFGNPGLAQVNIDDEESVTKFVISAANEKSLYGDFDSGFRPGVDDCPSVNYGSVVNPRGHCSGQSQLMLWYYSQKKRKGEPALNNLLQADGGTPTPNLWQDDTRSIRISTLIQHSRLNFFSGLFDFIFFMADRFVSGRLTMNAFRYAIKLTKKPQFIEIREDKMLNPAGHAMVVYKVEGDALYIADPNYPGNKTRRVVFNSTTGEFLSYSSGINAGNPGLNFVDFYYIGAGALISFDELEKFWNTSLDKLGEGIFPPYTIEVNVSDPTESKWIPLEDGYEQKDIVGDGAMVNLRANCTTRALVQVYENGEQLNELLPGSYKLSYGDHKIGIAVFTDDSLKRWIGFKYVNVKATKKTDTEGPRTGLLPLTVTFNNKTIELQECEFDIEGNFFYLTGHDKDVKYGLTIQAQGFHGSGEYNHATCSISGITDPVSGTYTSYEGKISIHSWYNNYLTGAFEFESGGVKVSGEISYRGNWIRDP